MKVKAIKLGFYGELKKEGDVFEVPEGEKASWFVPVDASEGDQKKRRQVQSGAEQPE